MNISNFNTPEEGHTATSEIGLLRANVDSSKAVRLFTGDPDGDMRRASFKKEIGRIWKKRKSIPSDLMDEQEDLPTNVAEKLALG
jgi:hypothetical protein